jgi:hypothetical protein
MSNHYTQVLIDVNAEDHTVGLHQHVKDPFLPRHFIDFVADRMDEANPIDLDPDQGPAQDLVYVEHTDDLDRDRERVLMRVAATTGYEFREYDPDRQQFTFSLNE